MYELEPASGIKASRVIQLADDIARNMSALSARVATIPGRSVIGGIELPNPKRETVSLSELVGNRAAFEDQNMAFPIVLGKNISGDPVINLPSAYASPARRCNHGVGQSVGLNCISYRSYTGTARTR